MIPQTVILSLGGFRSPRELNMESTKVAELAEVMKNVAMSTTMRIDIVYPKAKCLYISNTPVETSAATLSAKGAVLAISRWRADVPNTANQAKQPSAGAIKAPKTN